MRQYCMGTLGITRAYLKRFWRDKVALFFTFLFPLMFLLVFGTIFGNNSDVSFRVALINQSQTEFAKQFAEASKDDSVFDINQDATDFDSAQQMMKRGEIDSVIILPSSFGQPNSKGVPSGQMEVYYQNGSEQSGQAVASVLESILAEINKGLGQPEAPLTVEQKSTGQEGLTQFDYTFSGLLGFTILSMGIFGLANSMPQEKKSGAFRRLRASPFHASQLIIGVGLYYALIAMLSVLAMVVVGLLVFDFNMRGSWLNLGIFVTLAIAMMVGFGLLIGGWARSENQSAPLSNLISFPMMFLSGVFVPRYLFPEWLQGVTTYVPLTPVVDGFRQIMTENASLLDLGPQLGIMVIWTIAVYVATALLFRWE